MQIYTTRKVNNQVDFRIVSKIIEILRKKSIDDDYLQIFKIERNKIVNALNSADIALIISE